jgi:LemA protein
MRSSSSRSMVSRDDGSLMIASRRCVLRAMRIHRSRALFLTFALMLAATVAPGCNGVNQLPTLDEQVKAAWSEVLNQYQRRADLIPNLVETVKGYARQEEKVLTEVTEARAKATQMQLPADILSNPDKFKEFEQNQAALGGALGRLLAVSEKYPDLKSNQNFLALQSQLEGTENRIAVARRDYILAVQQYNTYLRTYPGKWIAGWMYPDMKIRETFTISEQAQQVPQVKF